MPHVLDIDLRFAVRGLLNGGLEMGVQSVLGGTTAWNSDVEPGPSRILAHHWPDTPNLGDITAVDWSAVEPVDVITGGSPCTDVSHAGKRAGMREGTRSGLWASMCEAIDHLKPRLVVWENVAGAHSAGADSDVEPCPLGMGHGSGVSLRATGRVVGDLSEMGFDSWWCTIRAADAGAPHGRARVFVFAWPAAAHPHDAAEHGQRARPRPGQRGARTAADADVAGRQGGQSARGLDLPARGTAADAGSLGWLRGPGVGGTGRDQAVRGEEVRHPGHVHRAPAAAADPDGLGPHGAGDARGRGAGPADGSVAAARLFPTPRASDGSKGGPGQRGSSGDLMLPSAVALLPTPAVNDMGAAYTPETWDAWTEAMRAKHGNGNGHGASLAIEAQRHAQDWGIYAPAIRRWEQVLGRAAPPPTQASRKGTPQLSPAFTEFLMGLPAGWVTDPAIGLSRNAQLRALGNGVVWQQCALATRLWLAWACEQAAS